MQKQAEKCACAPRMTSDVGETSRAEPEAAAAAAAASSLLLLGSYLPSGTRGRRRGASSSEGGR